MEPSWLGWTNCPCSSPIGRTTWSIWPWGWASCRHRRGAINSATSSSIISTTVSWSRMVFSNASWHTNESIGFGAEGKRDAPPTPAEVLRSASRGIGKPSTSVTGLTPGGGSKGGFSLLGTIRCQTSWISPSVDKCYNTSYYDMGTGQQSKFQSTRKTRGSTLLEILWYVWLK